MQHLSLNMMLPFLSIRFRISEGCKALFFIQSVSISHTLLQSIYIQQLNCQTSPVVAFSVFKFQLTFFPQVYRFYSAFDTTFKIFWDCLLKTYLIKIQSCTCPYLPITFYQENDFQSLPPFDMIINKYRITFSFFHF